MRLLWLLLSCALVGLGGCSSHTTTPASRFYHGLTTRYNALYNAQQAFDEAYWQLFSLEHEYYDYPLTTYPRLDRRVGRELPQGFDIAEAKLKRAIRSHSLRMLPVGASTPTPSRHREYNPVIHRAWLLLGQTQLFSGKCEEALETFGYVARLFDTEPATSRQAKLWQLRALVALGRSQQAQALYQELGNHPSPSDKSYPHLGQIAHAEYLLLAGDTTGAIAELEGALELASHRGERARLYYLLGQLQATRQTYKEAIEAWRTASKLAPTIALELSAELRLLELGAQTKDITRRAGLALSKRHRYKAHRDMIYWSLGRLEEAWGHSAKAEQYWQEALANTTWTSGVYLDIQEALAKCYLKQGQWLLACAHYKPMVSALAQSPGHPRAQLLAGSLGRIDSLAYWAEVYSHSPSQDLPQLRHPERTRSKVTSLPSSATDLSSTQQGADHEYFDNPQWLQQGRTIFVQRWGERPLTDRWRTSLVQSALAPMPLEERDDVAFASEAAMHGSRSTSREQASSVAPPSSSELEEAMWRIAQILHEDFALHAQAQEVWRSLLRRFPQGKYAEAIRSQLAP